MPKKRKEDDARPATTQAATKKKKPKSILATVVPQLQGIPQHKLDEFCLHLNDQLASMKSTSKHYVFNLKTSTTFTTLNDGVQIISANYFAMFCDKHAAMVWYGQNFNAPKYIIKQSCYEADTECAISKNSKGLAFFSWKSGKFVGAMPPLKHLHILKMFDTGHVITLGGCAVSIRDLQQQTIVSQVNDPLLAFANQHCFVPARGGLLAIGCANATIVIKFENGKIVKDCEWKHGAYPCVLDSRHIATFTYDTCTIIDLEANAVSKHITMPLMYRHESIWSQICIAPNWIMSYYRRPAFEHFCFFLNIETGEYHTMSKVVMKDPFVVAPGVVACVDYNVITEHHFLVAVDIPQLKTVIQYFTDVQIIT